MVSFGEPVGGSWNITHFDPEKGKFKIELGLNKSSSVRRIDFLLRIIYLWVGVAAKLLTYHRTRFIS